MIPEYETLLPNLYLAIMTQIYPEDIRQDYSVRLGRGIEEVVGRR
jgi:hypothetical protein